MSTHGRYAALPPSVRIGGDHPAARSAQGGPVRRAGAPTDRRRHRRGFTLLELLVAISVLAIVSMIAWRGLDSLLATRERLEPQGDEVRGLAPPTARA